jgi:hypothetical protein
LAKNYDADHGNDYELQGRVIQRKAASRFQVFTAVKIHVEVFWVVTPCSVVVGYERFGRPCCLCLQGEDYMAHKPDDLELKQT